MPVANVYEAGQALAHAMYVHGRQKSGDIVTDLLTRIDEMGNDLTEARKTLVNAGEQYAHIVQENEFLKGSLATCGRLINEVRDMTEANANECDICAQLRVFVGEPNEPEEGSDDNKPTD